MIRTKFQTVDTDFSPGDPLVLLQPRDPYAPFQTVDTDFSPGDKVNGRVSHPAAFDGFRPLTRISLLVTHS